MVKYNTPFYNKLFRKYARRKGRGAHADLPPRIYRAFRRRLVLPGFSLRTTCPGRGNQFPREVERHFLARATEHCVVHPETVCVDTESMRTNLARQLYLRFMRASKLRPRYNFYPDGKPLLAGKCYPRSRTYLRSVARRHKTRWQLLLAAIKRNNKLLKKCLG